MNQLIMESLFPPPQLHFAMSPSHSRMVMFMFSLIIMVVWSILWIMRDHIMPILMPNTIVMMVFSWWDNHGDIVFIQVPTVLKQNGIHMVQLLPVNVSIQSWRYCVYTSSNSLEAEWHTLGSAPTCERFHASF